MLGDKVLDEIKWDLLDQTVQELRDSFADVPTDDLHKRIDEALTKIRKDKRKRKARSGCCL